MMATPDPEPARCEVFPAQYISLPDVRFHKPGDRVRVVAVYAATIRDNTGNETKVTATRTTVLELYGQSGRWIIMEAYTEHGA